MRLSWVELRFYSYQSEEKLNHVLKTDDDELFKDLLTNMFFKQIVSWNFKMEFC